MISKPFYERPCALYGTHPYNPCRCGRSKTADLSAFAVDFIFIVDLYKTEKGIYYDPSIGELSKWLYKKIWEGE